MKLLGNHKLKVSTNGPSIHLIDKQEGEGGLPNVNGTPKAYVVNL